MAELILITGGVRSGKSAWALKAIEHHPQKAFIATSVSLDDEMAERIARHQQERGPEWSTIEESTDLVKALQSIPKEATGVVIDCLTVWLGNLMYEYGEDVDVFSHLDRLMEALKAYSGTIVLVTNEIGVGIVPVGAMVRKYRDMAGWISQRIAKEAKQVVLMVAGYPIFVKS